MITPTTPPPPGSATGPGGLYITHPGKQGGNALKSWIKGDQISSIKFFNLFQTQLSSQNIWLSSHQKRMFASGNIIKCLVYFVVPMNAAVHVMCFYYSSWNDKIYANIKISKVGKTWLSACTPVYSFSVVRTADTGGADTRFLQPWMVITSCRPWVKLICLEFTRPQPRLTVHSSQP